MAVNSETFLSLAGLCVTVTLAVAGGAIRICTRLEKLQLSVTQLVTREQCAEYRRQCRCGLLEQRRRNKRKH